MPRLIETIFGKATRARSRNARRLRPTLGIDRLEARQLLTLAIVLPHSPSGLTNQSAALTLPAPNPIPSSIVFPKPSSTVVIADVPALTPNEAARIARGIPGAGTPLTVVLGNDGVLRITGTDFQDVIRVSDHGQVSVASNTILLPNGGRVDMVDDSRVKEVVVNALGESDLVEMTLPTYIPSYIDGGAGDDQITGGGGDDTILGGPGNDTLNGDNGNDVIHGGDGNDSINGGGGGDTLYGDGGNDTIQGDPTLSVFWQRAGNDVIDGGSGDDTIHGNAGDDQIAGGDGNDLIYGDDGNDVIRGGLGDDLLYGGANDDQLYGDDGDDALWGEDGNDQVYGGAGVDSLYGGNGMDGLFGGVGPYDHFSHAAGYGADYVDGGPGADRVYRAIPFDYLFYSDVVHDDVVADASDVTINVSDEPVASTRNGEMPYRTYIQTAFRADGSMSGGFIGTSQPSATWGQGEIERLDAALKPIEEASPGLLRDISRPAAKFGPFASLPVLSFYRLGEIGGSVSAAVTVQRQYYNDQLKGYFYSTYGTGFGLGNAAFRGDANTLADAVTRLVARVAYEREVFIGVGSRPTGMFAGWFAAAGWNYNPAQRKATATSSVVGLEPTATLDPESDWASSWVMYFRNRAGRLPADQAKLMASRFAYVDHFLASF